MALSFRGKGPGARGAVYLRMASTVLLRPGVYEGVVNGLRMAERLHAEEITWPKRYSSMSAVRF